MDSFDLDQPIIELVSPMEKKYWRIRDAVQGTQIFGGIGSGKTSSAKTLALKYLTNNFGGLVLTVKPDEKEMWQNYCKLTGRSKDLVIIEPGGENYFNFLQYESADSPTGEAITENIVEVLKTVIKAGEEKDTGKNSDPFWDVALDLLIFNVIDLCKLAYGNLSVHDMYNIVQTIPRGEEKIQSNDGEIKAFKKAMDRANDNVNNKAAKWFINLPLKERNRLEENPDNYHLEAMEAIPEARLLSFLDQFFYENYTKLSEKTRGVIDISFSGFLFRLLREPIYSLFCRHNSNVTPEDSLEGKIILINLPVKLYHKVGRDCQILFKYVWQRSMEKRNTIENGRPVFLWSDEAQNFLHSHDTDFQATARSSRIATVYITQNLPNYYSAMGGQHGEYKVDSFLGTLSTKIFHANADVKTNRYASEIIGDAFFEDRSGSITVSKDYSQTSSTSLKLERVVRPEEFVRLKTGGPLNKFQVDAYLHRQGDPVMKGINHIKITFNQNYKP